MALRLIKCQRRSGDFCFDGGLNLVDINTRLIAGFTALSNAILHDHLECVQFLIQHGVDVNGCDDQGITALFYVNWGLDGHVGECGQFLMDHGADINYRDNSGWTVLMAAVSYSSLQRVEFFVERGSNLKLTNCAEKTIFDLCKNHDSEIGSYLNDCCTFFFSFSLSF